MKIVSNDVLTLWRLFFVAPKTFIPMKHKILTNFSSGEGKKRVHLDYATVKKALIICRAFDQKTHQRILSFFEEKEVFNEEEIAAKIRLELDVTQGHLRTMVRTKILNVNWKNEKKCYSVNYKRIEAIKKFYTELNNF